MGGFNSSAHTTDPTISMSMHRSNARDYYHLHSERIERWLDLAVYHPVDEDLAHDPRLEDIPHKVWSRCTRSHRRCCMLRNQLRLQRLVDLSRSRRVLDVGAGFGDFAIFADNYDFDALEACEPAPTQYRFLTERWRAYDRVYDLPLERMHMGDYDTLVITGIWIPDWSVALERHILVPGVRDVVINMSTQSELRWDLGVTPQGTWRYSEHAANRVSYSVYFMDRAFRRAGFHRANGFQLKRDTTTAKAWLHYRRT
jgi:SAM-dependent methyltransferase